MSAFLDPARVRLSRAGAALRATLEGERTLLRAQLVRAFPLSAPDAWFALRDGAGKEAGMLRGLDGLDAESRRLAEEELARRYRTPRILRLLAAEERFESVVWEAETDRGVCRFATRNLRADLLEPSPGRLLLVDVEGNRYEIPDLAALDRRSRRWIEGQM